MKQIHIQGFYGMLNAKEARELKIGDIIIFNGGYKSLVKTLKVNKTGKTYKITTAPLDDYGNETGEIFVETKRATTLLAIESLNSSRFRRLR